MSALSAAKKLAVAAVSGELPSSDQRIALAQVYALLAIAEALAVRP